MNSETSTSSAWAFSDTRLASPNGKADLVIEVADVTKVYQSEPPVTALLARSGGGYAVEVVDKGGAHHLVAVSLGLFDDADGLVQVTGSGLAAGQEVVVPAA